MSKSIDRGNRRNLTRREFVKLAAAAGVAMSVASACSAEAKNEMPYRALGRTGEKISAIGLGGYHIGIQDDEAESIRLVRTALDRGINFLDNCWDYNGGVSELRMGKALQDGYRAKAFLMSKIDGRTKAAAARQIDESLKRLQTDHVDLMQFHEIIRPGRPRTAFLRRRRDGGDAGGEAGRQGALHRLHRPQRSGDSSENAAGGRRPPVSL